MSQPSRSIRPRIISAALLALVTITCTERTPVGTSVAADSDSPSPNLTSLPAASLACDADNGGISLPTGFCAIVVADQVGLARHIAARPNGDIYVALRKAPDGSDKGGILALRDTDGNGKADRKERFGTLAGTGIAWYQSALYFAADDRVFRYTISGTSLIPPSAPVTIVSGLPATIEHKAKNITFSSSHMYVNIASGSNSCQVQNRTLESPGKDPCPELPTRAGVWRFDPSRTGQSQSDGLRFATGLRDMLALAVKPGTGILYGVQHDRDLLGKNWPKAFTMADDAKIPSEELVRIRQGDDYGWPYCHHDRLQGKKVLGPEYGGDGKVLGRCSTKKLPLMTFPAHWGPMSMVFYTKQQFPAKYVGGAFVAFHGDNFTGTRPRTDNPGYHVVFVPFVNGAPTGDYEVFASGFVGSGTATPTGASHRATGLAQGPDGSLYITDDKGGRIWRVIYRGP
ncbi:MAG: PQQ-dependent sugar dehydrogenase [Gemmatimonadota bacterium]|nr:PQQ-dependent sugar dehydrogenase [Gemmatimonadota bacterium]